MKKRAALLFALIISYQSVTASEKCESIKLVSFNIRNGLIDDGIDSWEYRLPAIEKIVSDIKPGILGVQEALKFQVDAIAAFLPEHVTVGLGRNGEAGGESNAIIYDTNKFHLNSHETLWFSDTPTIPSKHWGNNYLRIVTVVNFRELTTGKTFYVFNMHWDHESQLSRDKSAEMINNIIANKVKSAGSKAIPIFVMGDFNATQENSAIQKLQQVSMLEDTMCKSVSSNSSGSGTFHNFSGKDNDSRIDYIFYRGNVELTEYRLIKDSHHGVYPSDHFPVSASFRMCAD